MGNQQSSEGQPQQAGEAAQTSFGAALQRAQQEASKPVKEHIIRKARAGRNPGVTTASKAGVNAILGDPKSSSNPADDMLKSLASAEVSAKPLEEVSIKLVSEGTPPLEKPAALIEADRMIQEDKDRKAVLAAVEELKFLSAKVDEGLTKLAEKSEYVETLAEQVAGDGEEVRKLAEEVRVTKDTVARNAKVTWMLRGLSLIALGLGIGTVVNTNRKLAKRDEEHYQRILNRSTEGDLNQNIKGDHYGNQ